MGARVKRLGRSAAASLRRLLGERRGVAAVEMALATPLLLVLFCGTAEIAEFLSVEYRAAQMADTVSDAVARYDDDTTGADIKGVLDASASVIGATDFATNGYVILSSVSKAAATDDPKVAWRCTGGGSLTQTSRIGAVGKKATLPGDLSLDANDNVVVAEVFYRHQPLFDVVPIDDTLVYKTAVFRPRLGALTSAPGC